MLEVMAETAIDHFRGHSANEGFTSEVIKKSRNFVERKSSMPTDGVSHHVLPIKVDKKEKAISTLNPVETSVCISLRRDTDLDSLVSRTGKRTRYRLKNTAVICLRESVHALRPREYRGRYSPPGGQT